MSVNWVSIGSGNGLLPVWHQAITWTNADILSKGPSGTNFSEIIIRIQLKMSLSKWWPFFPGVNELTHWGRSTHTCASNQTTIGSDNGLLPGRHQAIIWTNDGILLIGTSGINFSEILIETLLFSFEKMHLKVSSVKWRPFCLGHNALIYPWMHHISLSDTLNSQQVGLSSHLLWGQ